MNDTPAASALQAWRDTDPVMGIALLMIVALLAGEAVQRWARLPRLIGPMLVGLLASPLALRLVELAELQPWKPLLDLAVGLLVFELGTRLRPRWLLDNPWLVLQCLATAALAGGAVGAALAWLGVPAMSAALAGIVAMSTSPVIAMATVHELRTRGQVTERLLMMAAIGSICAVLGVRVWDVLARVDLVGPGTGWLGALGGTLLTLCGSLLLGAAAALVLQGLSRWVAGETSRALLQLALVVLASLLAARLELSPLLSLLAAGIVAKARLQHALRIEPQFGLAGAALTLLLLLSLGLVMPRGTLDWRWVGAIIAARAAGQAVAALLLARPSGLGWRQAAALTVTLQPGSSLVVLMVGASLGWPADGPQPDAVLLQSLLVAVGALQIIGPLCTQWGLAVLADEARER